MHNILIELAGRVAALETHREHDTSRIDARETAMEERQNRMHTIVKNNRRLVHIAIGLSMASLGVAGNMSLDEFEKMLALVAKITAILL